MFTQDGKAVAAAGPLTEQGAAPSWTLYFRTPDADAIAGAVRKAGGTVRAEPADVMSEGRFAQFTDPAGALVAVWQPGDTQGPAARNDPGTLECNRHSRPAERASRRDGARCGAAVGPVACCRPADEPGCGAGRDARSGPRQPVRLAELHGIPLGKPESRRQTRKCPQRRGRIQASSARTADGLCRLPATRRAAAPRAFSAGLPRDSAWCVIEPGSQRPGEQ